jgi:hypothetical protein
LAFIQTALKTVPLWVTFVSIFTLASFHLAV